MNRRYQSVLFSPAAGRLRQYSLMAAVSLLALAPIHGAEPEEFVRDPEGARIEIKNFISDMETFRLSGESENSNAPETELPRIAPAKTEEKPAPSEARPAAEKPPQSKSSDQLTRRARPAAEEKKASAASQPAKTPEPKAAFAPAQVSSNQKKDAPETRTEARKESTREEKNTASAKPATSADKTKRTTAQKSESKPSAGARASAAAPASQASRKTSPPDTSRVLSRGDLTVNLNDGRVAAVRPSGRGSAPGHAPEGRISGGSYTVEGTVTGLLPRPDGRLHVLVATRSRETVQVIVSGSYAGQSIQTGQYVRLQGERIGGSDSHPVVEIEESAVPYRRPARSFASAPAPVPGPMPAPIIIPPGPVIHPDPFSVMVPGPMGVGPMVGPLPPVW